MKRKLGVITILTVVALVSCVSFRDGLRLRSDDFRGFENWTKVNPSPLTGAANGQLQGMHLENEGIREVFVNRIGESAFAAGTAPLPAGTIIVKDTYHAADDGSRGKRWNITVMRKRESGYDSENGDWEYVTAGPRLGVRYQGQISLCIDCHVNAERDYVFTWR